MASDTARVRKSDPGNPDRCTVYTFHKLFCESGVFDDISEQCPKAGIGCFDCKKSLAERLIERVEPIRERIEDNLAHASNLVAILQNGADCARAVASATMGEVREAMKMPTF
jgi:tryptophanyl-tRNA synthetase